jgi:ubiquinone/menaquinone biosynthesis C-methylase UbiE
MHKDVIEANIRVHTAMAATYNGSEPHYRDENKAQVRDQLTRLRARSGGRLLDIGCGTGFIIDMAKSMFDEIHGVDVTQAMLDRVDTSSGHITLHNCSAEHLPFESNYFDMVSSYAFIHHVFRYEDVLREAYRVVRPGGFVYIDLEPNRDFWQAIVTLESEQHEQPRPLSSIVAKELESVLHTGDRVEREYGIEKNVFDKAEYTKTIMGGIDARDFERVVRDIGFSECETTYLWFLGQGAVMHTVSFEAAKTVDNYLRDALPLTRHLYKYLRFVLRK